MADEPKKVVFPSSLRFLTPRRTGLNFMYPRISGEEFREMMRRDRAVIDAAIMAESSRRVPGCPFLWFTESMTGVDETWVRDDEILNNLTNATTSTARPPEFRREVLGEWLDREIPVYRHEILIDDQPVDTRDHRADSIRYAVKSRHAGEPQIRGPYAPRDFEPWKPSRRLRGKRPKKVPGTFIVINPLVAGELFPDAIVPYEADLDARLANPVFISRWGHLYVTPLESDGIRDRDEQVWCWNGEKWDDISGGYWAAPYSAQWRECKKSAIDAYRARQP